MKCVSFKIGKAIKEADYPQEYTIGDSWCYENGQYPDESELEPPVSGWILLPTYMEIWLWLWRKKGMPIELSTINTGYASPLNKNIPFKEYSDPEESIIAAIEYLVKNDLIK